MISPPESQPAPGAASTFAACGLCGTAWTGSDAIARIAEHYRDVHTSTAAPQITVRDEA